MYGLSGGGLWQIIERWRHKVLIMKLHIDIVQLVGYNKKV
jgi:hypothetical protein